MFALLTCMCKYVLLPWTFHTQMFVPAQCWVAPVTRWLPDLHNLLFFTSCNLGRNFHFFPLNFETKEGKWVSALCPWKRVTKPGMRRKEVTEARLSVLTAFLHFPPPLFPAPSLSDKGGGGAKGMMEQWLSWAPGWGSVRMRAHVCCGRVKRFRGGGLPSWAVSHHAVDPPGSFRCPSGFIILLSS